MESSCPQKPESVRLAIGLITSKSKPNAKFCNYYMLGGVRFLDTLKCTGKSYKLMTADENSLIGF